MHIMLQNFTLAASVFRKDPLLRKSLRTNSAILFRKIFSSFTGPKNKGIIIINLTEHIGDIIACEPVSYHLRKQYPDSYIIWSVNRQYSELVKYNPNIDEVLELTCLTEWISIKKIFGRFVKIFDLHINGKRCATHRISSKNAANAELTFFNYLEQGNLLQVGAMAAGIRNIPDYSPRFHFSPTLDAPLPEDDYIVIHPLSNEEEKNWCNEKWNRLVKHLLHTYPHIDVVEVGLSNIIHSDNPRYHNLTGKLDLQQIAKLIDASSLFIGVDSGFGHFANALKKNSIILMGYYQDFKNYKVYSGEFAKGENLSMIYYQGLLKNLELEKVEQAVNARLVLV